MLAHDGKWQQPGWRIEQRYSNRVLIGNWEEEGRGKFLKGKEVAQSSNKLDYQSYGKEVKPDTTVRRNALARSEGLGKDYLFRHHGDAHEGNQISWYDVDYNGRQNAQLPPKRTWDPHKLCWLPESSDLPTKGNGSKFGLADRLRAKWAADIESSGSVTASSFPAHDNNHMVTKRHACPKYLSSHFTAQGINKNLSLRGGPITAPRPEHPANIQIPSRLVLPQYTNATVDQLRTRSLAGQTNPIVDMPTVSN